MRFLLIALLFCFSFCGDRKKPAQATVSKDPVNTKKDTAYSTDAPHLADTVITEYLDSLFKLKPVAVMDIYQQGYYYENLIARFIDTTAIKKIRLVFSDTVINTLNKKDDLLSTREINRNKRFTIEIRQAFPNEYNPRKLYINGKQLRPGIELDTSHAGDFFFHTLEINSGESCLLQMGNKEYLLLKGFVHNCNGIACSVNYSILYDPVSGKAMLDEQYMTPLCLGFDKKTSSPVFIDHNRDLEYLSNCDLDQFSGKVYRWDPQNGIRPLLNKERRQLQFEGYHRSDKDSFMLTSAVFPDK